MLHDRWGDCDYGDAGSFKLTHDMRSAGKAKLAAASSPVQQEFLKAATACDWLCRQCHRCRYVSFTRRGRQECVWRRACDLEALDTRQQMYRSALVRTVSELPAVPPAATSTTVHAEEELAVLRRRRLIFITATYPHPGQLRKLTKCTAAVRAALAATERVLWILVEDAATKTAAVASLLGELSASAPGVTHQHMAVGPTRSKGNAQRSLALSWLREHLEASGEGGVAYNLDDDNEYDPHLWDELLRLRPGRVGVFAVGFPTSLKPREQMKGEVVAERPLYAPDGRLRGFSAGWCQTGQSLMAYVLGPRFFCVDMGGWAFDAMLLCKLAGVPWSYAGRRKRGTNTSVWRGGESEFLQQLLGPLAYPEDLQPLANCAHDVLVLHNAANFPTSHKRAHAFQRASRPVFCGTNGW